MSASVYPVHVNATLDTGHLSRWLWLVKWVLAIPHYVVLVFLWMTFIVLSAVALVSIVATGRYPRSIFDFNVGVLRWSWRVAYYAYGALATDKYPPFTLAEVPDYPAHLTVDYPEHLSRGLVLVKWWLLAIPHYLIVGLLVGSGTWVAMETTRDGGAQWTWGGGGLIELLVVIAAVVLLFTGRYPQQIFDLVLGLNRWVLRVAAYAGLMTDEYPPFRLDMGGSDPGAARVAVPAEQVAPGAAATATAAPPAAPPAAESGPAPGGPPAGGGGVTWTPGRVVTVVLGAVVFLMAGGFLVGGTTLAVADQTLRNDQGFLMTGAQPLSTESYAIASDPVAIDTGATGDWVPQSLLGDVAVRADTTAGEALFVGVAPTEDAATFLAGVEHVTLVDLEGSGWFNDERTPVYRTSEGAAPSTLPGDTDIWAASSTGTGEQLLTWEPAEGDWTVVVMNVDGTATVNADMSVGAELPVLGAVVVGMFVTGGILLVVAIVLIVAALHRRRTPEQPSGPAPA
ncbi:MAG TPA: DUF4389 domain-containing protein [Nocardioidaceae bacterium]|nr:DUF4389 domain-containing protein [Nocardioidaceae bacterium]